MPYVNVQVTRGVSRDQKAEIVKQMTDALVEVLGKSPEHIHVVLQEIEEQDWGFAGLLTDEWRASHSVKQKNPGEQTERQG